MSTKEYKRLLARQDSLNTGLSGAQQSNESLENRISKLRKDTADLNGKLADLKAKYEETDANYAKLRSNSSTEINKLSADLKKREQRLKEVEVSLIFPDRKATLDAICDQLVTATGFAYMMGLNPVGGLSEVNESNWSKFVDGEPQFDVNNKIKKGPDYRKPDLSPFV